MYGKPKDAEWSACQVGTWPRYDGDHGVSLLTSSPYQQRTCVPPTVRLEFVSLPKKIQQLVPLTPCQVRTCLPASKEPVPLTNKEPVFLPAKTCRSEPPQDNLSRC